MHVAVLKPSHKILPSCVLLNQHVTYAYRLNNETTLSTSATYVHHAHTYKYISCKNTYSVKPGRPHKAKLYLKYVV